ncbi:doublecortin domain-containing protein 1-like [Alexandromys fortis]|uniref:doublecortin domain-containing protein 1-like n=1 Tax=Alexandromys fortis TaxID=100897 RepID=UPI0021532AF0|nr:doublecortin domain-containing protein 1-like [Microtus fortis]
MKMCGHVQWEFMSNQAKAVIKTTDDCLQLQFGPSRLLPSVAVSQGSGLQDCSTHQTASDHSQEEPSNPESCKSKRKKQFLFYVGFQEKETRQCASGSAERIRVRAKMDVTP